jgi:hypothetical protein
VALAAGLDRRGHSIKIGELIGGQIKSGSPEVPLKAMELGGRWDRHMHRVLGEGPSERDLRRRRTMLSCEAADEVDQRLVGAPVLLGEPREHM